MNELSTFGAFLLGIVQGLTEFLPVSSSGHLTIFHRFLGGTEDNVMFDVVLHLGTLVATVLFFSQRIATIASGAWGELVTRQIRSGYNIRRILFIVIAVVPTGIIGVVFKDQLEALFHAPKAACGMLIVTGIVLIITAFVRPGTRDGGKFGLGRSLLIGLVQGIAIIPGISRSGSTISAGMFLGMDRKEVGEYSFLISIPAILGAVILKLGDVGDAASLDWGLLAVGFFSAFVVGLGALALLMRFVRSGKLWYFAPYCILLGIGGLIFL